jgi:glutamate synthase domain-containing protein 2
MLIVATVALHDLTQRRHAIKLAQGAKPGTGGWLPKEKITHEIAAIRGIPMGVDCQSPNGFDEFHDAPSLLEFIARVRRLTAKPVGLKLVVGSLAEIEDLCRAIREHGDGPDFIAVDGKEGGSGAAPLALVDHVGLPLRDALVAVDNALRREGLRDGVCVIASGKIATGADVATHIALGADLVHIARGFKRKNLAEIYPYPQRERTDLRYPRAGRIDSKPAYP